MVLKSPPVEITVDSEAKLGWQWSVTFISNLLFSLAIGFSAFGWAENPETVVSKK